MSSALKNLSDFSTANLPDVSQKRFAIVVAEWNTEVTGALYSGAYDTLLKYGVQESNIVSVQVPGSFELSLGAQKMAEKADIDAVICLGCVIQGETRGWHYKCEFEIQ
jgi:6,7-dimethyl-8-ribityllumazine synthase